MSKHKPILQALLALLRGFTYTSLLAAFVLLLSITNPHLLRVNRTTGIMLSSFVVLLIVFMRIYGGFHIGQQKSRPIIYQMSLSVLMTDIIVFLQLQVMNVNAANNDHLELLNADTLLLFAALAVQILSITACTYLGNYLYFCLHPPEKCCVITGSPQDQEMICSKIRIFHKQFVICDCIDYRDHDLHQKIRKNQTIMLFHLPPKVHQELIEYCYKCQKNIYFDLSIADILSQHSGSFLLDDVLMTAHTLHGLTVTQRFFKRTMDICASLIGLIVASPIMLVAAIAIKLDDGGPVLYTQNRLTRGAKIFKIYKFRTMREEAHAQEYSAVQDDARITRPGKILRRLRIDELPQLINILKGEMSLVGPRPEMLPNVDRYLSELPEYAYRCRVKAGLTGYAQILGKYNTGPREKLMMDISDIENYSLWLDVKLILKTLTVFFKHDSTEPFVSAEIQSKDEVS